MWFPVWKNATLYFKSVNKEIKLHYDNGITESNGVKLNWYGSLQTQKANQASIVKVGATYFNPNFDLDSRVRMNLENTK